MCGIIGLSSKGNNAPDEVFRGLTDIEYRGYDSWGIAYHQNNSIKLVKKTGFLPKKINLPSSEIAIGHTRWATHGGVTQANAHPHTDCSGKIVLVHNGIVENYLDLKSKLKYHKIKSETDSEVIVHSIEEELKNTDNLKDAVAVVFKKLKGLNAVVVTDGKEIVACKVGSPLVAGKLKDGFALASDPNALLPVSDQMIFLEDNQLVNVNHELKLFSVQNMKPLPIKYTKIDWDYQNASLNDYPHFMLKEMYEQPKVLTNLASGFDSKNQLSKKIKEANNLFLLGCGSAYYACLFGVYQFSKIAQKLAINVTGSEYDLVKNHCQKEDALLAISQSGETIDVVEPVAKAKANGAYIGAITNTLGSTLYRNADYSLLLNAGVEKAVCSTKALTAMFAYMILLAYSQKNQLMDGQEIVIQSAKEVEDILNRKKEIGKIAKKLYKKKHVYLLGRGLNYPTALESALKIKEISYIHAEGFAAGELKHGVIALIEKGTPVIVFASEDENKDAVIANALEVKARGACVIGVGPVNNPVFDHFFQIKDCGASSSIPNVVFSQILAYYISVMLGYNPDKPRNLAKSVVVK